MNNCQGFVCVYSMVTTVNTELFTSKLLGEQSFDVLTITTKWQLCKVMDMLIDFIMVNILQYTLFSSHVSVHLKLIPCHMSTISQQSRENKVIQNHMAKAVYRSQSHNLGLDKSPMVPFFFFLSAFLCKQTSLAPSSAEDRTHGPFLPFSGL